MEDTCERGEKPGNRVKVRLEIDVVEVGCELGVVVGHDLSKTRQIPRKS